MSTGATDRIISMLGQGFSQSVVANALGVSPSLVSQVASDDANHDQISALRAATLQAAAKTDAKIESLEQRALELIEQKMSFVRSPMDATRIFQALNAAKKKVAATPEGDGNTAQVVQLVLPKAATLHIQLNENNQVIQVGDRATATLPSRALPSLAATLAENRKQQAISDASVKTPAQQDTARAASVLANLTTVINGVECVL